MMPQTWDEFLKYVLAPGGMQAIAGWLVSLFAEEWPWFCELTMVRKRLVIWGVCGALGLLTEFAIFGTNMQVSEVYVALSLGFLVSQAIDLKNLAAKQRE